MTSTCLYFQLPMHAHDSNSTLCSRKVDVKTRKRISMGADNSTPATLQWMRNTTIEWTEEGATKLLGEIKKKNKKKMALNILVFGPTGCGKSSLCNGFKTALSMEKDVAMFFGVGTGQEHSYTKNFQWIKWEDITLYDMAGVFETKDIKSQDILNIVQGNVKFSGQMTDFLHPEEPTCEEEKSHISCVVLVLKPGMELAENVKRIIQLIHRSTGEGSLMYHLVLTHLDEEEDCFKNPKNLNKLLTSPKVQETVKQMSEEVGIPPNAISFVRNYVYESCSDIKSTVLFLHTFKQIVHVACEQEEKRAMLAAAK